MLLRFDGSSLRHFGLPKRCWIAYDSPVIAARSCAEETLLRRKGSELNAANLSLMRFPLGGIPSAAFSAEDVVLDCRFPPFCNAVAIADAHVARSFFSAPVLPAEYPVRPRPRQNRESRERAERPIFDVQFACFESRGSLAKQPEIVRTPRCRGFPSQGPRAYISPA